MSALHSHYKGHRIAVLMYHSISDRAETRVHPYFRMVTSPARFAQQMQWLTEAGAEVVALDAWNSPFTDGHMLRVIITFDDGLADFVTHAFPLLHDHGYGATMFLPTAFIETGKELWPGVKHLRWNDARQLSREGIRFGSHTANHRHLDTLSRREINEEVKTSTETMRNHLDGNVTSFSCPFAFPQAYPAAISALHESLSEYGYTVGVTTKIGTASMHDDPYTLKRLPVNSDDDKKLFMAKLNGGYNWLNGMQHMVRSAKKALHQL
jgi:peptidoglycan/xylan/chitin deacetylase (PgdA/CDA1 family)